MRRRYLTLLAVAGLVVGAAVFAPTAVAGNSFAISVGVPGLSVGYASPGGYGYVAAYPPAPAYYAPAPAYYGPTYYAPPVVYGGAVVTYGYRPWYAHPHHGYYRPYHRHW